MDTNTNKGQTAAEIKKTEVLAAVMAALPSGTTLSITAHHHTNPDATHVAAAGAGHVRFLELLPLLSSENAAGHSIIARPAHPDHSFLFLDDTTRFKIEQLEAQAGITPCLVIKTSAVSRQAIYVCDKLDKATHNLLFTSVNIAFGDKKITGADHSFKMPGFAQRKPSRARPDGFGDWVLLDRSQQTPGASLDAMRALVNKIVAEAPPAVPKVRPRPAQVSRQPKAPAAACVASGITPDAYARLEMIVQDRYRQAVVTYIDPDYSKVDYAVACWLAKQPGVDRQAAYKLLAENSPMLAARHPCDADRHLARTLAHAGF